MRRKSFLTFLIIVVISAIILSGWYSSLQKPDVLLLATTTSTANSGLLDYILPYFESNCSCAVKVAPVGTGQALELGRRGDADMLLVHAPDLEMEYVSEGYGTERYQIMYNWFVLVGPPDDPSQVRGENIIQALHKIYDNGTTFVSRGDSSGTHHREISLWEEAGYDYSSQIDIPSNGWYLSVGAGMGSTLMRASELRGYTLSDEGTFFAFEGSLELEVLIRNDPLLLNQYSVIPVNPEIHPEVKYELAMEFVEWITSPETQTLIGSYEKNGHTLFTPNAGSGSFP